MVSPLRRPTYRNYRKLQRRSVRTSLARFLSILGIVAIGTGFLAGLVATAPDMKLTVDEYYRQNRTMDVDVKGTLGLTEGDAAALSAVPGVETVMPGYVTDVIMDCSNGTSYVCRLAGMPLEKKGDASFLNDFILTGGRLPETPDEVALLVVSKFSDDNQSVGETLTVSPQNVDYEDRADTYAVETFTVVGTVVTPQYMSVETEPSSVGSGKVELVLYGFDTCYALDVYTDMFLSLSGADAINCFTDDYTDLLDKMDETLETLGEERSILRFREVKDEAQEKIDDAWDDYYEAKADAEQKLADARIELDDAQVKLADAKKDLEKGQKKYDDAHYDFYKAKNQFEREIAEKRSELETYHSMGAIPDEQYDAGVRELYHSEAHGNAYFEALHDELEEAKEKLADGEQDIKDADVELADAEAEYADAEQNLKDELAKGEKKINDAQEELDDLDEAEWVVTDRSDTVSYVSYKSNTEKIDAIAKVFPLFLFLVAALVALTTMTRMVEEERTQIGTLKALGYANSRILAYYMGYSITASLLGSALGVFGGFRLLPIVISEAYEMMYTIPRITTVFRWDTALIITPIAVLCTSLATLWACLSTLNEKPAALMLPKAPKAGKRILLERIPFLWNHLKFTQKVTCRNIFRYKKRLYMTMIGIAGCTALLLTGFGLRDSIGDIVAKQFGELYQFDFTVILNGGDALTDTPQIQTALETNGDFTSYLEIHSESGKVLANGLEQDTNIYVPKETDRLKSHIVLRMRDRDQTDIPFTDDSVVLTEKMCEQLNLTVGSPFTLENDAGERATLTVTGITENYVTSYAFLSGAAYERIFGETPEYDKIIATLSEQGRADESAASAKLLAYDDVLLIQSNTSIKDSFDNLIGNINYIVYVLIVAAGALAMIVLYNLTNINISERKKELATIKVLGFYEPEVAKYIYRETTVLSILGMLCGFVFGIWLHAFVVRTAEVDAVMFGRTLYPKSFLLAAAVTLLFTLFVDLVMLPKIRGINMVESMKAND